MECIFCGGNTRVTDKRDIETGVRRRRECTECGKRFTTYERIELNLMVIKKDGRREPYSRQKLMRGINRACEKRPVSVERIENIVNDLENEIRSYSEVSSKQIGELVMKHLLDLDKIAYIRFASVYRSFGNVRSFEREIKSIKSR